MVVRTHTVANPKTMMIVSFNAGLAFEAMSAAVRDAQIAMRACMIFRFTAGLLLLGAVIW